jgi:hypothetical protein
MRRPVKLPESEASIENAATTRALDAPESRA